MAVKKWVKRILAGIGILLILLVAAGAVYQVVGEAADQRQLPPPGELVDVGGYRLHLSCQGEGEPVVILDALSGGFSSYWGWIQPALAKSTRVCAYDRAGRAWSEPRIPSGANYAEQTVQELHSLLENAGVAGPYVLVGHSIGGVYMRLFADQYPQEVAGLVLLDAAHPNQFERIPAFQEGREADRRMVSALPWLARLGLLRLYLNSGGELDFQDLPPQQHQELSAQWSSPDYFLSQLNEMDEIPGVLNQAQKLGNLEDLPLIVITAGRQAQPGWFELQNELAGLSSNHLHASIADATHASLIFNPEHAQQVSELIGQLVQAVRSGTPLQGD